MDREGVSAPEGADEARALGTHREVDVLPPPDFMGEGPLPLEFDRVNWAAWAFAPLWVILYGPRRWLYFFALALAGPLVIENLVLALGDSHALFSVVNRFTLGTFSLLMPGIAAYYAAVVNREIWQHEQMRFTDEGGIPHAPIPVWRYRKSTRFWTRLFVVTAGSVVTITVVQVLRGALEPSAAMPRGTELVLVGLLVYDRMQRRRSLDSTDAA